MTDITYGITEEIYILGDDRRVSYGIAAYSHSESDGTSTIVASIRDISSDRSLMLELVNVCNRLSLSTDHLTDVICDFLTE